MTDADRILAPARRADDMDAALRPKTCVGQMAASRSPARSHIVVDPGRGAFLVLAAAALALPQAARACMSAEFEEYVFFDVRPRQAILSDGLQTLRVRVVDPEHLREEGGEPEVEVLEDALGLRAGQRLPVEAYMGSSCSRWGSVEAPAFVIGYLRRRANGALYFGARSFRASWVDSNDRPRVPNRRTKRRTAAELDAYIVDPEVKRQADEDRAHHD